MEMALGPQPNHLKFGILRRDQDGYLPMMIALQFDVHDEKVSFGYWAVRY
jgi:hypothetical protein